LQRGRDPDQNAGGDENISTHRDNAIERVSDPPHGKISISAAW
jgi:hypothetical protein